MNPASTWTEAYDRLRAGENPVPFDLKETLASGETAHYKGSASLVTGPELAEGDYLMDGNTGPFLASKLDIPKVPHSKSYLLRRDPVTVSDPLDGGDKYFAPVEKALARLTYDAGFPTTRIPEKETYVRSFFRAS